MKYQENIEAVARLQPDYLGFIFYDKSPRNFEGNIPDLPPKIKKTGVFVDASIEFIIKKVKQYGFKTVQLHGNESATYCQDLKLKLASYFELVNKSTESVEWNTEPVEVWKVFSIKNKFDFDALKPFESVVDAFLFDTKGKEKGGNGYTFNWSVLENYPSTTPFILSGGIGLDEINSVLSFMRRPESKYLYAIDVNSKFEIEPGLKNIEELEEFKKLLFVDN